MPKQIVYFFYILFCLHTYNAYSCGNAYWHLLNGKLHMEGDIISSVVPLGNDLQDYEVKTLFRQTIKRYQTQKTLENYSDYGSVLMYQGKYQEAKHVFWNIEAAKPNLYNTAANLGTICELLGQNDSALVWIQKAIALNPQSHYGSEWIHVKILEAKINAKQDTSYFQTHSIWGLDFGTDAAPKRIPGDREKYERDLMYQLTERMTFIHHADPIMAQLIFDLGNLRTLDRTQPCTHANTWTTDAQLRTYQTNAALRTYQKAIEYGFHQPIIEKRIGWVKNPVELTWFEKNKMVSILFGILFLLLGGLGYKVRTRISN